jgi:type IV pilus assembly protein PilM
MKRTAKKGRSILGIEINTDEIHVVEMEGVWPNPRILRADMVPTPLDSMNGDEISRPDLVGRALGTLLNRMGVRTRTAVLSIPSGAVTTRILDIPHIPEAELEAVVQNEIAHQNILPNPNGEFDYMRLDTGDLRPQARPRLLLMAAEERVLDGYHQAAAQAGLNLIGLEPGLVAMYRAASALSYSRPPCLCLMVGTSVSEVAIMDKGPIRVYRRLDLGSRHILSELEALPKPVPTASDVAPTTRYNLDGSVAEEESSPWNSGRIASDISDNTAVNSLTVELQRSLEYYQREYPDARPIHSIVIVTGQAELEPLAVWLSEKLHITATVATMPASAATDLALRSRLDEPTALRFLRASGLAMQTLENLPAGLPQFNLISKKKAYRSAGAAGGRMTFALAFSILILVLGSFNMFRVSRQAGRVDQALNRALEDRQNLSSYHGMPLDQVRRQKEILNVLLPVGEPLPTVVDAMAGAVPPDASLAEISREKPGLLSLSGETSNDTVLVQFLDSLRRLPSCVKVSLDSLNRSPNASGNAVNKSDVLHYQITAQIRPMP